MADDDATHTQVGVGVGKLLVHPVSHFISLQHALLQHEHTMA